MTAFPRILVTNDDGIDAPGLVEAERIAAALADEVWTIAPLGDQSGVGQGISMHQPLRLSRYGERRYAVSGTPADCVMYAMAEFFADEPPDLVLSGVNWGANLSDSVMYSGTVGAVLAANHLGIDAIALSQAFPRPQRGRLRGHPCLRGAGDRAARGRAGRPTAAVARTSISPCRRSRACAGCASPARSAGRSGRRSSSRGADGRGLAYHCAELRARYAAISAADAAWSPCAITGSRPCRCTTRCDEALFRRASAEGEHRLRPAAESA